MAREKEKYHKNTVSVWRRLGSFFADAVFFIVLNIAIYSLAIFPLTKSITHYNEYQQKEDEAYDGIKGMLKDAHLLTFDSSGNEIKIDSYFKENLYYLLNKDVVDENGHYYDIFVHFYVTYNAEKLTFNGEKKNYDISYVNNEIYKYSSYPELFELREGNIEKTLKFTAESAEYLNQHVNGNITAKSQSYFDKYISIMNERWLSATDYLSQSDQYKLHSDSFQSYTNKMLAILSYSSLITFTVLFALYYFLIPLLMKKGQTLAKKFLHIGIFNEDHTPIRNSQLAVRVLLQYIFYFFLIVFTPFLVIGSGIVYLPLFTINGYTFYMFFLEIVTLVMSIVSFIFMSININHRALHDKVLGLFVLPDAPEFLDKEEVPSDEVIQGDDINRGS